MNPSGGRRHRIVHAGWMRYGGLLLWVAAAHAMVTALLRFLPAFDALVLVPDGAIDLLIRHGEVRRWFTGEAIYGDAHSANYPPGSYTLLWPLLGWLPQAQARMLYALSYLPALAAIGYVAARASGAVRPAGKVFMFVFILPLTASMVTVWIGQLGLHVTAAVLAAAWLLVGDARRDALNDARHHPGSRSWLRDLAAAALLTFALVKPTLSVPLLAIIFIVAGGWRPAVLTVALYAIVTVIAAAPQSAGPVALVLQWLGREEIMNLPLGSVNAYLWLHWLGVDSSMIPVSLAILALTAAWTWSQRSASPWLLIGVAGLVSRLWIHHRAFDDVLLIIPAIALFQAARASREREAGHAAGFAALLAAVYVSGHIPYSFLIGEHPGSWLFAEATRTIAWVAALAGLVWAVHRSPGGRVAHAATD